MPPIDPRLVGETTTWLSIVSQLFSNHMTKLLEPYNMTLGQFSILHHISNPELKSGTRVSDIAKAIEMQQPAVTKTIAKFEVMGLVELQDDPKDRRAKTVAPQPKAMQMVQEIRMSMGPELMKMYSALGTDRLAEFATDLKTLGRWLDKNRL